MNALRHGSRSTFMLDRSFIVSHLSDEMASALNAELAPVRDERVVLLTALQAAISACKATATKMLLRELRANERRERAIVRSMDSRFVTVRCDD